MSHTTRTVLAVAADLLFASRIRGAAAGNTVVELARSAEDLRQRAPAARLILLDLDTRWLRAADTITALKADPATSAIPIIAFVSHVRVDAMEEARAAGADRVLARSSFVRELPELLRDDS
jgi:CheY-like chemotaxis protein